MSDFFPRLARIPQIELDGTMVLDFGLSLTERLANKQKILDALAGGGVNARDSVLITLQRNPISLDLANSTYVLVYKYQKDTPLIIYFQLCGGLF